MPKPNRKPDAIYTNVRVKDICDYLLDDITYATIEECGEFLDSKRVDIKLWLTED